jgi:hypothetical protein
MAKSDWGAYWDAFVDACGRCTYCEADLDVGRTVETFRYTWTTLSRARWREPRQRGARLPSLQPRQEALGPEGVGRDPQRPARCGGAPSLHPAGPRRAHGTAPGLAGSVGVGCRRDGRGGSRARDQPPKAHCRRRIFPERGVFILAKLQAHDAAKPDRGEQHRRKFVSTIRIRALSGDARRLRLARAASWTSWRQRSCLPGELRAWLERHCPRDGRELQRRSREARGAPYRLAAKAPHAGVGLHGRSRTAVARAP